MEREYSTATLWSTVNGKVVIPEAIAKYLESFGDLTDLYNKSWAVRNTAQVGFGKFPEDENEYEWRFANNEEEHIKYRNMFHSDSHKLDIIRAVLDGYVVHATKVAVRFGTNFAKSLEVDSEITSWTYQRIAHREDDYGCMHSYALTLSDYPEPWNYRDALILQEDFGGEIVKYG